MGFINYLRDTRGELRHVSWPSRSQTVTYTIVVVLISIFVGMFLGLIDFGFTSFLKKII